MTISSDVTVAQLKATAISDAVSALSSVGTPTLDSQTTVQGNTNAKEAIDAGIKAGADIAAAVQTATSNLQSVAHGFEALDNSIKHNLTDPLGFKKLS